MPIFISARTSPMVRTSLSPIAVACWPNACSTRARTRKRVALPCCSRADNGWLRVPRRSRCSAAPAYAAGPC